MSHPLRPRASDHIQTERTAISIVAAGIALLAYALCLSPTVTYGGDCGELTAASYRLGIGHPTGYPFYCLLGRLFADLIPFGEVGWRYNLLSAVCGAITVGLVAATIHRLVHARLDTGPESHEYDKATRIVASGGGALLLAGFYYFSSQAVIAEVYTLNSMMLAGLVYCAVAWHDTADFRWAYSCALLLGLALTAHLSCVFLIPGLLLYVLAQHRRRFREHGGMGWHMATMLLLFAAAYALTLYLPVRSGLFPDPKTNPGGEWWPLDWSHPADLHRWYVHVSAQQYKDRLLRHYIVPLGNFHLNFIWFRQTPAMTLHKLVDLSEYIALQLLWCLPLPLIGLFVSWRRDSGRVAQASGDDSASNTVAPADGRWLGLMLTLTVLFNFGLEIHYEVGDMPNFFFPAYIAFALWSGLGIAEACRWLASPEAELPDDGRFSPAMPQKIQRRRVALLAAIFMGSACLVQGLLFGPLITHRGDTRARDTALERAAQIESLARSTGRTPQAVISGADDGLWGFWYVKYVLGRAPISHTPWGKRRTDALESGKLVKLVDGWQRLGPVLLSEWDAGTDKKYPLVMLSPDGLMCLASHRVLPPPAAVLGQTAQGADFTILAARFHGYAAGPAPQLKRSDDHAFDIDFTLRAVHPLDAREAGGNTIDTADKPNVAQVGYIEVYMAPKDQFKTIPPAQPDIKRTDTDPPGLTAWRQSRRLIVPMALPPTESTHELRASVPLLLDKDASLGPYDVWVRLTGRQHDSTTPWRKTGSVVLSAA